jgi:hypothetical protein
MPSPPTALFRLPGAAVALEALLEEMLLLVEYEKGELLEKE